MKILDYFWNKKYIAGIGISIITILSVFLYGRTFLQNQGLIFTKEDSFILGVLAIVIIIVSIGFIITILMIRKQNTVILGQNTTISEQKLLIEKLLVLVNKIYNEIVDVEDNNVNLHRDTQELILELHERKILDDAKRHQF